MHAVVRSYSGTGASDLFDRILKSSDEVEGLLRGVKGFVSYTLIRTDDGGSRSRSARTRPAPTRASRSPATGSRTNAADTGVGAPTVTEGDVGMHLT